MSETVVLKQSEVPICLNSNIIVLPGDCLLKYEKDMIASNGTYLKNGYVYSSLAGYVKIIEQKELHPNTNTEDTNQSLDDSSMEIEVTKRIVKVELPTAKRVPFLEPGSTVTCRIIRTTSSFAKCSINCIEDYILKQPYTGIIRLEDIHECQTGQQQKIRHVNKCFRPGDIILARVIAPGENHQFLLTTAAPELGVVVALNDWSEPMVPISSFEVFCQRTYTKESRKVANINLIA